MLYELSNDLFVEYKELVCECIVKSNLKVNCDDILTHIHEEIDIDKFNTWLQFNLQTFQTKTNISSYFQKSFLNELKKGTFKVVKVNHLPNTQAFLNELRDIGISISADDSAYMWVLWEELLTKIPSDMASKLNHQIVSYMKTNEFAEYKELIQKSNTLKPYKVNWELINRKTEDFIRYWNDTLNELGDEL